MRDLVLLVADKNAQQLCDGAMSRPEAMGIRRVEWDIRVHVGRDGGVRKNGPAVLELERRFYSNALLLLDWEGCGAEVPEPAALERDLDERLQSVWGDRAKAIVVEPEIDIWAWGGDNAIAQVVGWREAILIRAWLTGAGHGLSESGKPLRPKEALEAILRHLGLPRSSAVYRDLARRISLVRCSDPGFCRVRDVLRQWFPPPAAE